MYPAWMRLLAAIVAVAACSGDGRSSVGGDAARMEDGAIDGQATMLPTAEQLAIACVTLDVCTPNVTIPQCMGGLKGLITAPSLYRPEQIACLANAGGDCAVARACIGLAETPCTAGGKYCQGSMVHSCDGTTDHSVQCAGGLWYPADATCVIGNEATCGYATCSTPGEKTCIGDKVHWCQPFYAVIDVDCSLVDGWTCVMTSTGATCGMANTATCTVSGCVGDVYVDCIEGREARLDCSKLLAAGRCSDANSCVFGAQCNYLNTQDTFCIDSDRLSVCSLGVPVTVSCKQLGFTGCNAHECY
jgi:hypothetical protein